MGLLLLLLASCSEDPPVLMHVTRHDQVEHYIGLCAPDGTACTSGYAIFGGGGNTSNVGIYLNGVDAVGIQFGPPCQLVTVIHRGVQSELSVDVDRDTSKPLLLSGPCADDGHCTLGPCPP